MWKRVICPPLRRSVVLAMKETGTRRPTRSQRSLKQLIAVEDPAWPMIRRWIADARHVVEVLPAERTQAVDTLLALQVTTRSPLGALALETGGILVDHGWL